MGLPDSVALEKSDQKKFTKKTDQIKRKLSSGTLKIVEDVKERRENKNKTRGLIYVGHIPHGFYEEEMKTYFSQFGTVTNTQVCRSNKTGRSKGFGFVEFLHAEVGKIAAETMNNYVMFKKRVVSNYIPFEKRPKHIFIGKKSTAENPTLKFRKMRQTAQRNKKMEPAEGLKKSRLASKNLSKKLKRLQEIGIKYDIVPQNVPQDLISDEKSPKIKENKTKIVKSIEKTPKTAAKIQKSTKTTLKEKSPKIAKLATRKSVKKLTKESPQSTRILRNKRKSIV